MYWTSSALSRKLIGTIDAPVAGHREQGDEEPCAVLRDDRHPLAGTDTEGVEAGGHGPGGLGDVPPGQPPPAVGGLVRLVDHTDAVAVDVLGAIEEVEDVERVFIGSFLSIGRPCGHVLGRPPLSDLSTGPGGVDG